ncbi:SusD/RagB family nutrient-binding outer membrane lipoprotein [Leeuwenhoekiella sp. MAR_2009_132]|uniref:SusD/RagB family nutrient-binding outer membrane lipoprotein n=1 Tax=Leeuwenhoekiella sp. MAR_2009_132 TaxID=1392489 RepID=UPI000689E178|nr:SusD/RagB family nutrient-binding outer membrane lipoprotein [Leeuwenhoekiella sp. MAR_2009_132]
MKNTFYIQLISLLAFVSSCTSYVDELNDDPNQPTDAGIANIIQGVQLSNQFWQAGESNRTAMLWINQGTGADRQYIALNDWNTAQSTIFDGIWNEAMVGTISQAQVLKTKATALGNTSTLGMAQVIEANAFGTLTSLFGDIPFSEVNKYEEFPNPKYEDQAAIYTQVQSLLDQAIDNLQTAAGSIENDLVYNGDTSKWIACAYTLKARYYLHVGNYPAALTAAQNGIMDAEGDYKAYFGTTYGADFNPFYSFLVYDRPGYLSAADAYAPKILDPSTTLYRGNSKTDESARFAFNYLNFEEIYNSGYELNFFSVFDWGAPDGKFGTESDMPLVTYGENLLIIAECRARESFSAGLTAYNNYRALLDTGYSIGLDNDGYADWGDPFNYDSYVAADFATGGLENTDGITPSNALLREILEERYIYFIGHFESFVDFNRTNNIAEITLKSGFNGNAERFVYPQVEVNGNSNIPMPLPGVLDPTPVNQ